jgi:hypothetical protein
MKLNAQDKAHLESCQAIVAEIARKSKVADFAYEPSLDDADKLLSLIAEFGQQLPSRIETASSNPAVQALVVFKGTVNKEVAMKVRAFLETLDLRKKLDMYIESELRSTIMRMSTF